MNVARQLLTRVEKRIVYRALTVIDYDDDEIIIQFKLDDEEYETWSPDNRDAYCDEEPFAIGWSV